MNTPAPPTAVELAQRNLEQALHAVAVARAQLDDARAQARPADYKYRAHAPLTHTLTLTRHQLGIYQDALEWYARWNFGQIEHLMGSLEWSRRRLDAGVDNVSDALWALKRLLFPKFRRYESHGIGWEMPDEPGATERNAGQVAYEMYRQVLVHNNRTHHQADPSWMGNVYDSETLHYSDQALPQVVALDPEAEVQWFRELLGTLNRLSNGSNPEDPTF